MKAKGFGGQKRARVRPVAGPMINSAHCAIPVRKPRDAAKVGAAQRAALIAPYRRDALPGAPAIGVGLLELRTGVREDRMAKISTPFAMTIAVILIALSAGHADAQSVARIELQPIQTVTLKTQQILTGETKGAPATLAGELRIPKPGSDRLPAGVLIHGSAGGGRNVDTRGKEIQSLGAAAFILHT